METGDTILQLLNAGCIIERSRITRSIIGLRSRIAPGAVIEDSLVMGADYYDDTEVCGVKLPDVGIGRNCVIRKAIIDKNVQIGRNVVLENRKKLRNYDDPGERFYIRDGIIIVTKGAVLENGTKI